MAKRFTDSEKWNDAWFMDLPNKYKLFWLYLLDNCDHAGIWKVNFKVASFYIGEHLEHSEVKRILASRITPLNDEYWFIEKFIFYQYNVQKEELKSNSKVQNSVLKILNKFGIFNTDKKEEKEINIKIDVAKIDDYIFKLKDEEMFLEGLYRLHKFRKGTMLDIATKFKEHLKIFPTHHKTFLDFRRHFGSWVNMQVKKGGLSDYLKNQKGQL
jgi:hypothetical protein